MLTRCLFVFCVIGSIGFSDNVRAQSDDNRNKQQWPIIQWYSGIGSDGKRGDAGHSSLRSLRPADDQCIKGLLLPRQQSDGCNVVQHLRRFQP